MNTATSDMAVYNSETSDAHRLSPGRVIRLAAHAHLATGFTVLAAAGTGVSVLAWRPDLFLLGSAQSGLRWGVMVALFAFVLFRVIEAAGDGAGAAVTMANGLPGKPYQPLGRWLGMLAVLLALPLWPSVVNAWHVNSIAPLTTPVFLQHLGLLAAPWLGMSVVAWVAIESTHSHRRYLHQMQNVEQGTRCRPPVICRSEHHY